MDSSQFYGPLLFLFTCGGIVFVTVGAWAMRHLKKRTDAELKFRKEEMASKQARAHSYQEAFQQLAVAIQHSVNSGREMDMHVVTNLRTVTKTMARMDQTMALFAARADGKMDLETSERFIRRLFSVEVYYDIISTIDQALRENDYENRKSYVASKINTNIVRTLADASENARTFPLSISPEAWMPSSLAGAIWARVEPLFRHKAPVAQRIEEMRLIVQSVLREHVDTCARATRTERDTDLVPTVSIPDPDDDSNNVTPRPNLAAVHDS